MVLHAEVRGDPAAATPLVLLHGFGGHAGVWEPVLSALPPDVPVIAFDLPGHAGSLGAEPGGAGRMAKAVLADLDRRGIARFHLAGHSLGGATAALIALREPARVQSITLLAPGGFGPEINADALAEWRDAADEDSLRAALSVMCGDEFIYPPDMLASLAEARRMPGSHAALSRIYESMFVPGEGKPQGVLPLGEFAKLDMPLRVLWGTEDRILPVSQSLAVPANVTVECLDGAGHMLIEERPGDVARVMNRLFSKG